MVSRFPFKHQKQKTKKSHPAGISEKVIRLLETYTAIAQNKFPSIESLSERFGVTQRTAYRYLEIINFIDPVEFDKERKGYKFAYGNRIKKLALTDSEFLLLLTMGEGISHLGEPLKEAFQKFTCDVANVKKLPLNKDRIPIIVKIPDAIGDERLGNYFTVIYSCIKEKRSIDIVYNALHSKETSERRVDPYGLVFYEGAWILISYCHLREDMRNFALDRILSLRKTNLYFRSKENFDLDEYLSHSWGIVYDKENVNVTVRFSEKVAEYILRKDKWHPSEKRKILPSGEVELSFTVPGVNEIRRWICAWIPHVEVIEPEWFRERLRKELLEAAQKHK